MAAALPTITQIIKTMSQSPYRSGASNATRNVATMLRQYVSKCAAASAPERATVADGEGGITTQGGQPKPDPGVAEIKQDIAPDGTMRTVQTSNSAPERATVADGEGGITHGGASATADSAVNAIKDLAPASQEPRKSASERVRTIQRLLGVGQAQQSQPAVSKTASAPAAATQFRAEDLDNSLLLKIGHAMTQTEEGMLIAQRQIERMIGAKLSDQFVKQACEEAARFDAIEQVKYAAVHEHRQTVDAVLNDLHALGVTDDDADRILKTASVHMEIIEQLPHPLLKMAHAQGMDDAAAIDAADESGGEEAAEGAVPMGGEELTEEEAMQLIQELIDSKVITPEDLQAAIQSLGAEGGAPEGGAPPAAGAVPA